MESSMTTGQMIKYSLAKLIYEFLGTLMLTMIFIASGK